jgi:Putative MetA-pathway of phenol degradation
MRSWNLTWLVALVVLAGLLPRPARAGGTGWSSAAPAAPAYSCPVTLGPPIPAVTLGQPVPLRPEAVAPVAWKTSAPDSSLEESLLWIPRMTVRGQMPEEPYLALYGPPPVPPPGDVSPNPFPPPPNNVPPPPGPPPPGALGPPQNQGVAVDQPINTGCWNKCCDFWKNLTHCCSANGHAFQSDQGFNDTPFIDPITSPFQAMNPLSLTELRPIFIYQTIPSNNPMFGGGNAQFYGLQGSLAFNELFSVVVNKVGFVSLQPDHPVLPYSKTTGFAELWLGPKFTFFRCPNTGTAIAGGLTFQLPIGERNAFQDQGTLGLDPYISIAQNIRIADFGSINLMNTTGYSFSLDNIRSDYFHSSFHIDYDILNNHHFFPLLELNWYQYTQAGKGVTQNFEGADLFNFGANGVSGRGFVSVAPGLRYRFNDNFQMGAAGEWKVAGPRGVDDFRLTIDFIFRY